MENTGRILAGSGEDAAEWYVVHGDRWIGPMTIEDVFDKIHIGEISIAHFAWKKGDPGWRRLCDIAEFQAGAPEQPAPKVQKEIATQPAMKKKPQAAPSEEGRVWFLYYSDSQFGPFSSEEITRYLSIGKIHGRVHTWRDGMESWTRIGDVAEFKSAVADAEKVRPQKAPTDAERRTAPRKPLVARLMLANDVSVVVAVCRDVSIGGMQVLTDRIPGKVGQKLKMNITPGGGVPGGNLDPFIAEGVVVRILEDGRGFSFRFERLADQARKSIEQYIAQGG